MKTLEIKTSMLFNLDFANNTIMLFNLDFASNTILSCFFLVS